MATSTGRGVHRCRRDLCLAGRLHLCAEPALLRGHDDDPGAGHRHRRCAGAGDGGRQRHHRPHLPRRLHRTGHAGRPLPDRSRGGRDGLQLLRCTPGRPRGHDAWHVRQRAAAQSPGAGHRGRGDPAPARRRPRRPSSTRPCSTPRRGAPRGAGRRSTGPARSRDWAAKGTALLGVRAVVRRASSASTAPTSWAWASSRSSSTRVTRPWAWASPATSASPSAGSTSLNKGELPRS